MCQCVGMTHNGCGSKTATGWRRVIGCLIFILHFPQMSPMISGSFARIDLQLRHPMGLRHPVSCVVQSVAEC